MPKISVIIPVYNVEKYISKCLESVINQTFKDIEIICANDKTPDKSFEIVKEYAKIDSRIVLIENEKNIGLGLTRNVGINIAKGEYIGFIDSDDYIDKNYYSELYSTAKKYNVDLVTTLNVCNVDNDRIYYESWSYSSNYKIWKSKYKKNYNEGKTNLNITNISEGNVDYPFFSAWNRLFRLDFLEQNKLRVSNLSSSEDTDFILRLFLHHPTTAYNHRAIYYYIRNNSASLVSSGKSNSISIISTIEAVRNTINYYKSFSDERIVYATKHILASLFWRFDMYQDKLEIYKYIHDFFVELNLSENDFIDTGMYTHYKMFKTFDTYKEYTICKELKDNYEKEIEALKIRVNWLELFGIYNNKKYIRVVIFGISFSIKVTNNVIDNLAWFIPVRKWRNDFKKRFE